MRRDLGTTQFVCRDKKYLATISVMKTSKNIQESGDMVGNKCNRLKGHVTTYLTSLKSKICIINYHL